MSNLFAEPQLMAAAAADLAAIASTVKGANKAAAGATAGVLPAGGDEVSAGIAAMFGIHSQAYQAIGAHAAAFHDKFVQALQTSAGVYANTEATNTSSIQQALGALDTATGNGQRGGPPPASGGVGASAGHGGGPTGDAAGAGAHSGNGAGGAAGGPNGDVGGGAMSSSSGGGGGSGFSAGDGGAGAHGSAGGGSVAAADVGGGAGSPSAAGVADGGAAAAGTAFPTVAPGSATALSAGHAGGGSGDPGVVGAMGVPTAPAASLAAAPTAVSPAAASPATPQPAQLVNSIIPTHPDNAAPSGNPARPGDPVDGDHDKALQLIPVPLPKLRGLRKKLQGLRNREDGELRKEAVDVDEQSSRPVTPEDLLFALGLRPPGHG